MRDFIRQLAKQKTVILTTHDMDEADRLSDRLAIIDHGKILAIDSPQKIKQSVGIGDILQIRINENHKDIKLKLLNSLPTDLAEVKYADGLLQIGGDGIFELIPTIDHICKTLAIHIEDMSIRKRTLEDAFIAMTGRRLRE